MFFNSTFGHGFEVREGEFKWAAVNLQNLQCHLWTGPLFGNRNSREDSQVPEQLEQELLKNLQDCKVAVPNWSKTVSSVITSGCLGGYLELPHLTDQELELAVPSAISKKLPWSLEEVHLTVMKVSPLSSRNGGLGLFFLAVSKQSVADHEQLLKNVGLKPSHVELLPLSLRREFQHNHGSMGDCVGLVHLADRHTHVLFLKGKDPYFYRSFSPGYADFVYAVQMDRQCAWKDALEGLGSLDLAENPVSLEPILARWAREISRCFLGLSSLAAEPPLRPARLYLSGAHLPKGLESRLERDADVPSVVDGWEKIRPLGNSVEEDAASFKVAVGLALNRR